MQIVPDIIPFLDRPAGWLSALRRERTGSKLWIDKKKGKTKARNKRAKEKGQLTLDTMLSMMTTEQMKGYLKGIKSE